MEQVRAKDKDIDKYSLLQTLQDGSEAVYYGMLMRHTRECMPLVYTPTGILLWCVRMLLCVSAYNYICVRIRLYMCPHTTL